MQSALVRFAECSVETLDRIPVGQSVVVAGLASENAALRVRLLALGLTPETVVRVARRAPLGDPIEIVTRNTAVSLRLAEAAAVFVRPL